MPKQNVQRIDLTGQRFGRWKVLFFSHNIHGKIGLWACRCECGTERLVRGVALRHKLSKSCGCLAKDQSTKHGHWQSPTYESWHKLIQRTTNPNNTSYRRYGGRGITVCKEWLQFENFLRDMGKRPSKDYSIERIDNNLGYAPSNCKWATKTEQMNNTSRNIYLTWGGHTLTKAQWARKINMNPITLDARLRAGWSIEDALTRPVISS